jgi:hypothetical protein
MSTLPVSSPSCVIPSTFLSRAALTKQLWNLGGMPSRYQLLTEFLDAPVMSATAVRPPKAATSSLGVLGWMASGSCMSKPF